METVVRTPRRQSLVDFAETGLSAWELFVNGISFDTSENTAQLQDGRSANPAPHPQVSVKKAQPESEGVEAEGTAIPDHVVAQVTPDSFLGIGSEKQDDPGGKKIQVGGLPSTESLTTKVEIFQEDAPKKCARDLVALRSLPSRSLSRVTDTMEHGNSKLLTFLHGMDKPGTRTRENARHITNGRRKNMPNWGLLMGRGTIHFTQVSKTSSPRMLNRWARRSTRQQRKHSALSPELDPSPPDRGRNEPDPRLAPHVAPGPLIVTWGMNIKHPAADHEAKQRKQIQLSASEARDRRNETRQMPERTGPKILQDMTRGSTTQTVTECASTHIITTTGCDRPRFKTSFRALPKQENNNRRAQPGDYQKGGAMYNLPLIATSESSLGSSVMRILQKPSPRVRLAEVGNEIGTTSKCHPGQGGWHTNKNTESFPNIYRPAVSKPDSPVTTDLGIKGARVVDQRPRQQGDAAVGGQPQTALKEIGDAANRAEEPQQAAAVARGDRATCVDMFVQDDELTALVQAPGRFPDSIDTPWLEPNPPDDWVGARNTVIAVRPDDGFLGPALRAGRDFLGVMWCYILPAWQMYWERVGPLFNLKSEYWARQNRDEGTVGDCLTVVLSIPMTLLFIAGYMMALRLGLLCIENGKAVQEWAGDVYWYVRGE
ncbi:hypothetical protein E4U42_002839 [Claviceps africana]|uniref:Uncharacterized protein n=1 Tax=Claviceps africana TaxID=83212 RepID=A0A8K0J7M6_9HYPO|nr:hypothetical protein E4U42_002839 [Claviceps africana]